MSPTIAEDGSDRSTRLRRALPALAMLAMLVVAAGFPLLRNTIFFYWDDTVGSTVPIWRRLAESVLDGRLPLLEPDMWRGGAFAAEASTGMFNPVMMLIAVAVYPLDNMALAMTIAKTLFLMLLALGVYFLARRYRVRPWIAAAVGAATPLATQTFYWDASSWTYSLMATAFLPWVWIALHRAVHSGGSLLWVVLAGYLCCSLGNPYGLLATGVLVIAFMIETAVIGKAKRAIGLAVSGASVLAMSMIVYLPLVLTSAVGWRSEAETYNDEFLSPNLSDLFGMSTPINEPWISSFGSSHLAIPAIYLAWFVLPLLPWLRWQELRGRGRTLTALAVFGAVYFLLVLGPSQIWMFRWPLRLVTCLWFPIMILWAILASAGLERTRVKLRAALSFGAIFLGGFIAWGDIPDNIGEIALGGLVVAVLVGLVVWRGVRDRFGIAALMLGTLAVLGLQLAYYPSMNGVTNYRFPTSQKELTERFAKYEGMTVQIANVTNVHGSDLHPGRAYQDMLFGSMYSTAGVETTTAYSGIGFTKLDNALCVVYQGSMCRDAWKALWLRPLDYQVPLADLLRVRTVVVQNSLVDTRKEDPPPGWRRAPEAESTDLVTVWKRVAPLPHPDGRVSHVSRGVTVDSDRMTGTVGERLNFKRDNGSGPASISFARLAWPGYVTKVNGQPVDWRTNESGLLVVDLPEGVTSGELEIDWKIPGLGLEVAAFAVGLLLAAGVGIVPAVLRRRRPASTSDGRVSDVDFEPDDSSPNGNGGRHSKDAVRARSESP
ncbi:hypothetical protein [Herbihabitans rhizosphaerae]|nr:hypothetical protein [Herbihabitans rhizosphaerae]